jgi:hypothetical protein
LKSAEFSYHPYFTLYLTTWRISLLQILSPAEAHLDDEGQRAGYDDGLPEHYSGNLILIVVLLPV